MIIHYDWPQYILAITININNTIYNAIAYYTSQEEFVESLLKQYSEYRVSILHVMPISDETFDMMAKNLREIGQAKLIVGE